MYILALIYTLVYGAAAYEVVTQCNKDLNFAFSWRKLPGTMKEISATLDGSLFGINNYGQVYRLVDGNRWEEINPYFRLNKIAYYREAVPLEVGGGMKDLLYGVTACGKAYKLKSDRTFEHIPHTKPLIDIAVGAFEEVWAIDNENKIYRLNTDEQWVGIVLGGWVQTDVKSLGAVAAVHSYDGYLFTYNALHETWRWIPNGHTISLTEASITNDGYIYGIDTDNTIWHVSPGQEGLNQEKWTPICNKKAMSISAIRGSTNEIYIVDMDQNVYTTADPRIPDNCFEEFEWRGLKEWWRCGAPLSQCPGASVCQTHCTWYHTNPCPGDDFKILRDIDNLNPGWCGLSVNYICVHVDSVFGAQSEPVSVISMNNIDHAENVKDVQYHDKHWTGLLSIITAVVGILINIFGLCKYFGCFRCGFCSKGYKVVSIDESERE